MSFSCCDIYYHLSQYWTFSFLATMNKCTELKVCISGPMFIGQVAESMHFRTHVQWSLFRVVIFNYHLSQYWTIVFNHYEQVYRTQKVHVSGPMFIGLFFLFLWVLPPLKIFFLTPCIIDCLNPSHSI